MNKLETISILKNFINKKEKDVNIEEMRALANMLLIIYDSLKFTIIKRKEN